MNYERHYFLHRAAPCVNTWGLTGWCVEAYFPLNACWVPASRFYFTRRGARRRAAQENANAR